MSRWLGTADADAGAAFAPGHPVSPYLETFREAAQRVEWIDLDDEWDRHPAAEVLRHALDLAAERSTFTPLDVVAEGLGIELPAD